MSVVFDELKGTFFAQGDLVPSFPWDAWKTTHYFMFETPELIEQLVRISHTARRAFTLAVLEWICSGFSREPKTALVEEYVDAVWAATLWDAPLERIEFDYDDWQGPVCGPLRYAQLIADDVCPAASRDGAVTVPACWAFNLAAYVAGPAKAAFEDWAAECLKDLQRHHPLHARRWTSIFDPRFLPEEPVAPNVFVRPGAADLAEVDRGIREQVRRTEGNRYLARMLNKT